MRAIGLLLALVLACAPPSVHAQSGEDQGSEPAPIRAAVRVLPRFVMQSASGELTGFSVDLWRAIAERLGRETEFVIAPDVRAQLEAVAAGEADVGVGAISITAERNRQYDFSQPILNAGLQIMVRSEPATAESTAFETLIKLLTSPAILVWLGIACLLSIVPAHIVFFLERRQESGIVRSKGYFPGIFEAYFWGLTALAAQADAMPRQWLARIFAALWVFTGVVFVAFYTAQLTASLTVAQFRSEINGPADLPGHKLATLAGSTSAEYLRANGAPPFTFERLEGAVDALLTGQVDAIVFDAPVLQYYATHEGQGRARVVGSVFRAEDYGFALRSGEDLRKDIDGALLAMREDGAYLQVSEKYFGKR